MAVLVGDPTFGEVGDIFDLPRALVDRLRHYFLTYKRIPGDTAPTISVDPVYGKGFARSVLTASLADYQEHFG